MTCCMGRLTGSVRGNGRKSMASSGRCALKSSVAKLNKMQNKVVEGKTPLHILP